MFSEMCFFEHYYNSQNKSTKEIIKKSYLRVIGKFLMEVGFKQIKP